jgi:hypothetical protein
MATAATIIRMQKSGLSEEQVASIADYVESQLDISHLATKADIADVRREIAETKADLIKWMFGIAAGQIGLLLAILKLFPGGHP